jgi:hypothetical protein
VSMGMVPGIVEAFEYIQSPGKTSEVLLGMMTDDEKWDKNYRLRAALALTRIAEEDYLVKYQKAASEEEDEEVRKEMVGFTERLEVAKECGGDAACWIGKLQDSSWRVQEKAMFTLIRMADRVEEGNVNDVTYLMRSTNQDVLKVLFMVIPLVQPGGCKPDRTCERLAKIVPYWRAKPQFKVRANDAECNLALLIHRQGGTLADMHKLVKESSE